MPSIHCCALPLQNPEYGTAPTIYVFARYTTFIIVMFVITEQL